MSRTGSLRADDDGDLIRIIEFDPDVTIEKLYGYPYNNERKTGPDWLTGSYREELAL